MNIFTVCSMQLTCDLLAQGCPNVFQRFSPKARCSKIHKKPGHSLEVKYALPHLVYLSKYIFGIRCGPVNNGLRTPFGPRAAVLTHLL